MRLVLVFLGIITGISASLGDLKEEHFKILQEAVDEFRKVEDLQSKSHAKREAETDGKSKDNIVSSKDKSEEEEYEVTTEEPEVTTTEQPEPTTIWDTTIFDSFTSTITPAPVQENTTPRNSGQGTFKQCYECPVSSKPEFSQRVYVATYLCGEQNSLALQTPILIRDDHQCVHVYGDIPRYFDVTKVKDRVYVNIRQNVDATFILEPSIALNINMTCPGLEHEESATCIINFAENCFE